MEFWPETRAGDMSVPNTVTCLWPWGQTGAIRSRLALFARPRFAACGLDRLAPARRALGKRLKPWWERHVPLATHAAPLANGAIRDLFAASSSAVRSHEQKTSFLTLGTRLGPEISLVSPAFLCSAKRGRFSAPTNLKQSIARKRRSMIAQATARRRRRRH